jgi:hypothetical protein
VKLPESVVTCAGIGINGNGTTRVAAAVVMPTAGLDIAIRAQATHSIAIGQRCVLRMIILPARPLQTSSQR